MATFLALLLSAALSCRAQPSRAQVAAVNGYPEFRVDGKPFFIHAAAFHYFRLPRDLWESSLKTYRDMGINTIDLYIPWNWHEPRPGEFDFDGGTDPRKDVLGLLETLKRLGLRAIVRPGPYVCAEWKNGGYPDWLLQDPSYKMSRRSILEGRYPPLSSLQYPDPEAAAQGWLANGLHLRSVEAWYQTVASRLLLPYSIDKGGPILLVQLDDDQIAGGRGNGPAFWKYMKWLRDAMRRAGVDLPMSLNPPETEVPSLGDAELGEPHLWLMNQWYQRFYGLELSTASVADIEPFAQALKTSPEFPPGTAEFNAGFFGMENAPYGMAAHPSGTLTASRVLFQNGLKALVYFPLQDTLYPAGYEIPSANPHYVWESPLDVSGKKGPKAAGVERNGGLIRAVGGLLAASHEWADVGVIEPLHAMDLIRLSTGTVAAVEKSLLALDRRLIGDKIASDWVDPEGQPLEQLLRYPALLGLPADPKLPALSSKARRKLRDYEKAGGRLLPADAAPAARRVKTNSSLYATELVSNEGSLPLGRRDAQKDDYGFVFLTNLESRRVNALVSASDPYDADSRIALGLVGVPARDSLALPLRVRIARLLARRPEFLAEKDEIYYATGELAGAEAPAGRLRLTFYAPGGGEAALRLGRKPKLILLNGRPVAAGDLRVQFTAEATQVLELVYDDAASAPAANIPPLSLEFAGRVDYALRPDVVLASSPSLLLVGNDGRLSLILNNPSPRKRPVSVVWKSSEVEFHPMREEVELKSGETRRLAFKVTASSGVHAASVNLESEGSSAAYPVMVLRVPAHRAIGYPYDFDRDGNPEWVLENDRLRVTVSPAAGGRIFQLVDKRTGRNVASTGGLLRDVFALAEPLDVEWEGHKLPGWTRSRTPGLNTRAYSIDRVFQEGPRSGVALSYHAPDVSYQGAAIRKTLTLEPDSDEVAVHYEVALSSGDARQQLTVRDLPLLDERLPKSRLELAGPAPTAVSEKGNYAILETGLGPMPEAKTYVYDLRYRFGPPRRRSAK